MQHYNNIAIRTSTGSVIVEDNNEFNRGAADANGINYQRNAYTLESDEGRYFYSELLVSTSRDLTQHTGTAALTKVLELDPIPAYRLENLASRVRVEVYGRFVGVTAGTTIGVKFNGNGNMVTIVGGPLTNNSYELSCRVREAMGGGYRQFQGLYESAEAPRMNNAAITFDPATELTPEIWVQLADAADDMYIDRVEVFVLG